MFHWTVEDPARIDVFLSKTDSTIGRIKAKELVKAGCVMVNGRIARKPAQMLVAGDVVEVSIDEQPVTETRLEAHDFPLDILYEDDACFVIHKPAGVTVHPGAGLPKEEKTILHGVVHLFKERGLPFSSGAVLVHRLDKDTTGCLLIAKTPAAHKELQKQFENRTVRKTYLALVAGVPNPPAAVIEASIGRSTMNRTKMTILGSSKAREAKTTYHTLASSNNAALLACDLHTGRTHQIRVHLHGIGHPILGDPSYNTPTSERLAEELEIQSVCLHAWKLAFVSPSDAKEHVVMAKAPASFMESAKKLNISLTL